MSQTIGLQGDKVVNELSCIVPLVKDLLSQVILLLSFCFLHII